MNQLLLPVRLFAAAAAVAITLLLLDAVVSIAAPQRLALMAREQHFETPVATSKMVIGLNDTGKHRKTTLRMAWVPAWLARRLHATRSH